MRRILIVLALIVPGALAAQQPEFLHPYGPPTRPFSPAVKVGNTLYLAGQVGTPPDAAGWKIQVGKLKRDSETRVLLLKDQSVPLPDL